MRYVFCGFAAALALAACSPSVPDSAAGVPDTGRGVGFGNYADYQARREAALINNARPTTVPGPVDVQGAPLATDAETAARAVLDGDPAPVDGGTSVPQVVTNSVGISDENDFSAVSAQRDIQDDAALIAQNRAQYEVIAPTDLPTRPGTNQPNIVEFALRTTNPKGVALYSRSSFRAEARYQKACEAYTSGDLAQEDFLALGGPEKDRKGMDPDGDGFACSWDPAPFRAARNG
ncbi:hypothetical protein [Tropicibacter oceani]|uniref:Excalibur calcium-binding domain-containing protein n=1 Tax=Tropicibacter oceani TaxID=3058420 RepID=A0ABY8QCA0_9RHOB|nr:hypothetical protein [Tropicibacter oceani]WGW02240.1 hypothetical protein QF118_09730 [Tropicibacter oceani]